MAVQCRILNFLFFFKLKKTSRTSNLSNILLSWRLTSQNSIMTLFSPQAPENKSAPTRSQRDQSVFIHAEHERICSLTHNISDDVSSARCGRGRTCWKWIDVILNLFWRTTVIILQIRRSLSWPLFWNHISILSLRERSEASVKPSERSLESLSSCFSLSVRFKLQLHFASCLLWSAVCVIASLLCSGSLVEFIYLLKCEIELIHIRVQFSFLIRMLRFSVQPGHEVAVMRANM